MEPPDDAAEKCRGTFKISKRKVNANRRANAEAFAEISTAKGNAETQSTYLNLLRWWLKNNNFTPKVVAAYMTGILPIKKDGSQSAISDFKEYTILNTGRFVEYTGFTESDVRSLCWNRSYWKRTSAAESLTTYINMDFEGLQETIARLISDEEIEVRTARCRFPIGAFAT